MSIKAQPAPRDNDVIACFEVLLINICIRSALNEVIPRIVYVSNSNPLWLSMIIITISSDFYVTGVEFMRSDA